MALVLGMAATSLFVAAPADAKMMSLHHVELTGPGIDGVLVVSPDEFGRIRNQWSPAAVALAGIYGDRPKEAEPPTTSLGPRFSITYVEEFFLEERELKEFSAELYPYARGGPITYWRSGQRIDVLDLHQEVHKGWVSYPPRVIANLRRAGLPAAYEAMRSAEVTPSSAWPWAVAGMFLALTLWGGSSRRGPRSRVALGRM